MNYDDLQVTFSIGDFPPDVQNSLLSTLDINGFISNESKFRDIIATNLPKLMGVDLKKTEQLQTVVRAGNLLTLERDAEKNQFGLNFALNTYLISLDVVPGRTETKKGTKILAVMGISKQNDYYLTAYEDEEGNYRYAGKVPVLQTREKLFIEPIEETAEVLWIDPKKFKKVKIEHTATNFSLQDTYAISDKVINVGKKLSSIASNMKALELVDTPASLSQLMSMEVETKMPSLKQIQEIVKDPSWQALREDLSWRKENIDSSLRRLRQYLGSNPSRKKKVRVLNLLNGVARGGIMNDKIKRLQNSLRKQLGVGEKVATKTIRYYVCSWCRLYNRSRMKNGIDGPWIDVPLEEVVRIEKNHRGEVSHGMCPDCEKAELYKIAVRKEAVSNTPPVLKFDKDNHQYTLRVKESERTTSVGNWLVSIDEDGKTVAMAKIVRWPEKDYELMEGYVMTDIGQWADADTADTSDILKFKNELIDLIRKYEAWSIEVGPKSELGTLEDWKKHNEDHGIEKEAMMIFSAEYEWSYSPMKGGRYGRLSWLVPAILEQTRIKDNKWDPEPLTEGDLEILKQYVKKGRRNSKELQRELNYYREWHSGKWTDRDKENIRNEVLERVTGAYQQASGGKLPPFLKDPVKVGDRVRVKDGQFRGGTGTVIKVTPEFQSALVRIELFSAYQEVGIPWKHLEVIPKEKAIPEPKPAEPKRQYESVKEELEKLLGGFQPGNWHAFMQGLSPNGTYSEKLAHMYRERIQFKRPLPTLQEIMQHLGVDNTAVSHLIRSLLDRARQVDTYEKAKEFLAKNAPLSKKDKKGAFMPSLGRQPFWDQHAGGTAADFNAAIENLYPTEWWDTWNAYAKMDAKIDPKMLLKLLLQTKPLSTDDTLKKVAILEMDPDIALRFYIPKIEVNLEEDTGISGTYVASLIGKKPSSAQRLRGVDPEAKQKTFLAKTPAERIQEGKIPSLPIPQEGERAPIYFLPGIGKRMPDDEPFKPLATSGEVVYQVKRIGGDAKTPDIVVGYFDAIDFLTHYVKKGKEEEGLRTWLTAKLKTHAVEIKKFLTIVRPEADIKDRLSWKARLLQAAISEDWDEALFVIRDAGLPREATQEYEKAIAGYSIDKAFRENNFEEVAQIYKKYRAIPKVWKDLNIVQFKEKMEQLPVLAGKTVKPSNDDFAQQATLVLEGSESFPKGGSVEAKRKILRDISIPRLMEYILSDKFLEQAYAVQSTAVRRLESSGTSGEEGLFAVWKKKDLPSTLRKEALNALVLAYGVGTKGHGYSPEGRFKATKNLLTEAADDPDADIRAAAYMLMKDPSVDFLPWTNQGKFTYSPSQEKTKREQPSRDIPEWMLVQLRTEPYSELRNILYDLIEELPKNLVKEDDPPKLSPELKILSYGKYSFKEELLPGITQLILTALTDSDPRVRARIRNYFGLPRELDLVKKEKAEPTVIEPSAKNYIFHARVSLNQQNADDAEKQLAAAAKAHDAAQFKEEIERLKKSIADVREDVKNRQELEKQLPGAKKALLEKYPDLVADEGQAFLDWASRLRHQTTFNSLSLNNKIESLKFLTNNSTWFAHWKKTPNASDFIVQPELPLNPEPGDDFTDKPLEKKGNPLSKLELASRQPPTTWQLQNPGPGYSAAFPLGERDDDLLLKDVRQFYGRPEGKWRSILNQIYEMLFKKKEKERDTELDKTADKNVEDMSEDELIEIVKKSNSDQLLRQVLQTAERKGFVKVVLSLVNLPPSARPSEKDIQVEAIKVLYHMKAISELGKLLFTPWHPHAVRYLSALGQNEALKATFRRYKDSSSLQRHIVLVLGESDPAFLEEALESPNADVRRQAAEWLVNYHKDYAVLKKHLEKEPDQKTKTEIERLLALVDEAPTAPALPAMSPDEQEKKIGALIKVATDAFTRWEKYPEIRREVLGKGGRRYGISTFNDWATAQKEIDTEITEKMDELPTMAQGQAALRDLEKIVEKLPDATQRVHKLKQWIEEAQHRYDLNRKRLPEMSDAQWQEIQEGLTELDTKIKNAKENLSRFEAGLKADLSFRVEQLKLLETSASFREELMNTLLRQNDFKKEYGLSSRTWKNYQAYLLTFDKNLAFTDGEAKLTKEGLETLEDRRNNIEKKYTTPIREKLAQEEKAYNATSEKLVPFYKKMGLSVDESHEPIAPGTSALRDKIRQYRQLEEQWFKLSGAVEPYAEVDDVKYRITPALWILPSQSTSLPEYGRGKRLVHEHVAQLHSPWSSLIHDYEEKIVKLHKEFMRKIADKLPEQAKEFMQTKEQHLRHVEKLQKILTSVGAPTAEQTRKDKELVASKKEYEEANAALIKRLREAEKLKQESPEDYIKLQVDLKEFMNKYSVPPIPEGPEANLKRQYFYDRWRSPGLRAPRGTPQVVIPGEEAGPRSGGHEYTDEERAQLEKEIARRIQEYGPPKFDKEK